MSVERGEVGLNRWSRLTAAATFLLLIAGGMVTSTGSGLAVPDWPLSFGTLFPKMTGGVFYEHGHRLIAGTVAVFITILAVWLARVEKRRWVRGIGYAALGAVVLQAVLGGVTVLLKLPPVVSVAHACLAQAVFSMVVAIAVVTSPGWAEARPELRATGAFRRLGPTAAGLVYFQLLLGAILRHTGSGLEEHLGGAALVTLAVAALVAEAIRSRASFSSPRIPRLALAAGALVAVQVALGLSTLFATSMGRVRLATAHVANGALLLALLVVVSLWAHRLLPAHGEAASVRILPQRA